MATCYKCGKSEVTDEFERCKPCEAAHKKLCEELDARPKNHIKPVKEELFPIKEVKQGIPITTWISREDAGNMGIQLPQ
mgnify:CR=1 FL=1